MSVNKAVSSPAVKTGPCTGKKFLVTGGSRGLGKAIVAELYQQGAIIYTLARNAENLKVLKEEFPTVATICANISDWEETEKALKGLEPVDCLVNNAAITVMSGFMETTKDTLDNIYQTNLRSVLNISQIIAKKMIESGKGGSIVNVSSISGRRAIPAALPVCIMKASLEMLTNAMAIELGPHKITVNSVCPGVMGTDMLREINDANNGFDADAFCQYLESKTPTKASLMPVEDVVNAVLFFGSNACPQITGESLLVDGGISVVL